MTERPKLKILREQMQEISKRKPSAKDIQDLKKVFEEIARKDAESENEKGIVTELPRRKIARERDQEI